MQLQDNGKTCKAGEVERWHRQGTRPGWGGGCEVGAGTGGGGGCHCLGCPQVNMVASLKGLLALLKHLSIVTSGAGVHGQLLVVFDP